MKVFLATLFFVGFAAAVPCPILEKLETQLQQGAEELRVQTERITETIGPMIEEAIATYDQNPPSGPDALKKLFADVINTVLHNCIGTMVQMNTGVNTTISELKKLDPKLVKDGVYSLLDNFVQQQTRNYMIDTKLSINLLSEIEWFFDQEIRIAKAHSDLAPKVQKKMIGDWLKFVDQSKEIVKKTEQLVHDTLKGIDELYQ